MASFKVFVIMCLVVSTALSKPLEDSSTTNQPSENIGEKPTDMSKSAALRKSRDEVTTEAISSSVSTTPKSTDTQSSDVNPDEIPKLDEKLKPEAPKESTLPDIDTKKPELHKKDQQLPGERQGQFDQEPLKPPSKQRPDVKPEDQKGERQGQFDQRKQPLQPPSKPDQESRPDVKPEDQNDTLTIIRIEAIPQSSLFSRQPQLRRTISAPFYRRPYTLAPQQTPAPFLTQSLPPVQHHGRPPLHHGFIPRYRDYSDEWDDIYGSDSDEDDYEDYLKANYLRHLQGQLPRTSPYAHRGSFIPSSGQFSSPGSQYGSQFPYRSIVKRDVADELSEMKKEDKKSDLEITKNVEDDPNLKNPKMDESNKLGESLKPDVLSSQRNPNEEKLNEKAEQPQKNLDEEEPSKDQDKISVIHFIRIPPSDPFHDASFGSILPDPIFSPFSMFHRPPLPLARPIPVIVVQPVEGEGDEDAQTERDDSMTFKDEKPFEQTKPNEAVVKFKLGQDKAKLKMRLPRGKGHYELKNGRGMARKAEFEVEDDGDFKLRDSKNTKDDSKERMFSLRQGDFKIELNLDRAMRH